MDKSIELDLNNSKENGLTSQESNNKQNGIAEEQEENEGKANDMPTVGVAQLFRYADKLDVLLMILGTVCACANGAALPCLMIVFGDMTDLFIDSSQFDNATLTILQNCNLESYGLTLSDVVEDMNLLSQVLVGCNRTDVVQNLTENFQTGLLDKMSTFSGYYFLIGVIVIVAGYGQVAFWRIASIRQTQVIRTKCFRQIIRMEIGWFDTHEVGELNTRLSDDINKISDGIGEKMGNFFQWICTFIAGIIIGFIYGWKLALVILACSPLLVASGGFMTWVMSGFTKSELKAYAKAGAVAEEVFGTIRTVVAFGGQEKETVRYGKNLDDAKRFGIRKSVVSGGGMGVVYAIVFAAYALAFWYGSKLVRDGEYSAGQMLIVFFAVMFGAFGLGNASPNLQNFAGARGAAFAIWEVLDRISKIDSASEEGSKPETLNGMVSFSNVSFAYPSRPEMPVLRGLSLDINRGQTVALVGASGCGKSTTVQLLQRFYDPTIGEIKIDGQDIRNLNIKWLRQHIDNTYVLPGMVSQEPVLFATTIRENIMFGKEGVTEEDIVRAATAANAHNFICNLPKKYDTLVGERGAQLSGGQKQRIAIARALVRDPKILLLDEATSALDTESEAIVQEALDKARQGRTTLIIAHRLSTVQTSDHIYSIKDGQVYEHGTHEELMEKGESGIYYQLVMNQKSLENEEDIGIKSSEVVLERQFSHGGARRSLKRGISKTVSKQDSVVDKEEKLPDVPVTRLLRTNAPEWLYIVLGCVSALANGAIMPAFAVIFAEIIGVFGKPVEEQEKEANFYSAMFLVIGLVAGVAMFFQAFFFGISGENLTVRIRRMAFAAFLRQEIAYFDDHANGVGALCTRLATDASAVQGATGVRLGSVLQSLSSIGTGLVIGFIFSWKLTLLVVAFIPFIAAAGALQMKILGGQTGKDNTALEEAGKVAIEAIENIRVVVSLTKEQYFDGEYVRLTEKPCKDGLKKAHFIGLTFSISQSLIFFAYAACFYLGAYLIENDGLYFEDMFKVFAAIVFGAMAIGQASAFAPDYNKAKVSAARIFKLFDIEPCIDSAKDEGVKLDEVQGDVQFSSVQFFYPTRPSVQVLKGLDLHVKPGMKVALVGGSGCGKSTVVSLLERFYDPAEGFISIDGKKLTELNVQNARSKLGIVQQEPLLFDTSIKENIAYGDNFSEVSMDRIIKAARDANIHSFIESLPDGYETNVGDKGAQLSGGQKQRVAIARALVRNPKVLLLDEATSALDTESEKIVQDALEHAQEGRTSIVIAHRLSTIQNADIIVVIKNGKVAEQGTHSDLLQQQGLYYNLHLAQQKKM